MFWVLTLLAGIYLVAATPFAGASAVGIAAIIISGSVLFVLGSDLLGGDITMT
jgi:hypothetical protein